MLLLKDLLNSKLPEEFKLKTLNSINGKNCRDCSDAFGFKGILKLNYPITTNFNQEVIILDKGNAYKVPISRIAVDITDPIVNIGNMYFIFQPANYTITTNPLKLVDYNYAGLVITDELSKLPKICDGNWAIRNYSKVLSNNDLVINNNNIYKIVIDNNNYFVTPVSIFGLSSHTRHVVYSEYLKKGIEHFHKGIV